VDAVLLEPGVPKEGAIEKDGGYYECPKNVPGPRRQLDFMHGTRMCGLKQEFDILGRIGQMAIPTHFIAPAVTVAGSPDGKPLLVLAIPGAPMSRSRSTLLCGTLRVTSQLVNSLTSLEDWR